MTDISANINLNNICKRFLITKRILPAIVQTLIFLKYPGIFTIYICRSMVGVAYKTKDDKTMKCYHLREDYIVLITKVTPPGECALSEKLPQKHA